MADDKQRDSAEHENDIAAAIAVLHVLADTEADAGPDSVSDILQEQDFEEVSSDDIALSATENGASETYSTERISVIHSEHAVVGAASFNVPEREQPEAIWFEQPSKGRHKLSFSPTLDVEWRLPDQHEEGGVNAEVVSLDGISALSIQTPVDAKWSRLSVKAGVHGREIAIAVQALVLIDGCENPDSCWIEPLMARRMNGTRKEGLENTRVRLPVPIGSWVLVSGLFLMPAPAEDVAYDFLLHLPAGCKARISRVDIDILETSGDQEKTGSPQVLYPFSLHVTDLPARRIPAAITAGSDRLVSRLADTLAACSHDVTKLGAELLLMNAQPGVNLLIEAYLHWAGYDVAIAGANISRAYSPDAALLGAILRLHMGSRAGASLIERDHLALKLFTSLADEKGVLALIEPRPLHLQLWGANPTEADNAYWAEYLSSGLLVGADAVEVPDGQVLEVMARARISPLAIAAIRTINKAAAGFDIQARVSEAVGRRWTGKIVGFPEEGKQVHVGTVSSVIKGARFIPTDPIADLKEDSSAVAGVASKVAFENCYAYVLKLDAKDKNYASLDNIENCLVFDDIEELRSALIEATPAQLAKPVIILHPGLHDDETYIPRSVARHWSYGGRYILAPAHFSYVVETGDIKIELVENDIICRFTLTGAVTSLPASQICDLNPHSQLLFPKDGICIAYADANLTIADVAKLEREYRPKSISSSDFERLTLRSSVDGAYLDTIDLNVHWPLSKIVSNFRIVHRDLKDLIRIARRNPTEANVNALFAALTRKGVDIAYILSDLFGFIRETSSASTLTLSMKPEHLVTYISYARRSPDADEIAINMSTYADKICLRDVNLIFPLFELLASCLDQAQLSAVLAFCASRCVRSSDRYTFRVAEGLRRYGDSTALALLLVDLYNADQVKLQKRELLRSFEPLLRSDLRASIERQLGSALIERIEATVEVSDRIDRRVRARDRQGAMELLGSSLSIARLDFFKLLDRLRALSNELREIAIPISAIACDGLDHQPKQLLAAAVFSDTEVIRYLCELGLVDQINDINAVARNIAGDNAMLNGIVATAFDGHDVDAYEIEGDSVPDVFAAASRVNVSGVGDSSKKVTVIMSAFNPDIPLMEQAVASVMNQSHRNLELIIIDDASAPELAAEISTIAGRFDNCSLIRLETNAGPYIGRNLAIEQATGDYIAIHDADDWAHPDRLRAQLAMFEKDPHARLLTAYHIRIDRAGKVQFEADFSIFGDGPMTSMFKRDVFNEVGPFAYVRSRGDVEMRERIRGYYGHHAIVTLPLPLLLCFADTSTLSQQTKANNLEYLQLFRTNISRRSPLGTFRRKEEALSAASQILVPKRLRAAMPVKEQVL